MQNRPSQDTDDSRAPVRSVERLGGDGARLWDARIADQSDETWFDPDVWRERGDLLGHADGRGAAYFLRAGSATWVLRHYRRGGLLARVNRDHYLWAGVLRTRPVREFRLLSALYNRGLPVPRPIAARAVRHAGVTYTADLLTEAIPLAKPLADRLGESAMAAADWTQLGIVIAWLHRAGVWHADLNARNVLVDPKRAFHLIDFDCARFRGDGSWRKANLKRFRRSLDKFAANWATFHFADDDWQALIEGYRSTFGRL